MNLSNLSAALAFAFCLLVLPSMAQAQEEEMPGLLPLTAEIEASAAKALKDCEPKNEEGTTGSINKNGIYTLTGNLFHNGRVYAVIDNGENVILCEWQKPSWKTILAIKVQTEWNFPEGYREHAGRSPDGQLQPFWMLDLQGRPLLAIASWVEKAGQNYYVFLFDSKCERILSVDASFALRPVVKHGYLLTGDSSRVKSEWEATYFSKIKKNEFVMMKSWENSQPWHAGYQEDPPDDSSNYASSDGKGYFINPGDSGDKNSVGYVIWRCDPAERASKAYERGELTSKTSASIYFMPGKAPLNGGEPIVYIFQKLTGLPKELFPGYENFEKKEASGSDWKVKVTGSDKPLIKLLSKDHAH